MSYQNSPDVMNYQNSADAMPEMGTLFTLACGAVAGAALALIFAPATGRETRAFLAQRSRGVVDRGRATVIERGRHKAFEWRKQIGHVVKQGKAGYRDAIRRGRALRGDEIRNAEEAAYAVRGVPPAAGPAN